MIIYDNYILLERDDNFDQVLKKAEEEGKTLKTYSVVNGPYSGYDIFNGTFGEAIQYIKRRYIEDKTPYDDDDFSIELIHIDTDGRACYTEEIWNKAEIKKIIGVKIVKEFCEICSAKKTKKGGANND